LASLTLLDAVVASSLLDHCDEVGVLVDYTGDDQPDKALRRFGQF